jgi:hypothetical protein
VAIIAAQIRSPPGTGRRGKWKRRSISAAAGPHESPAKGEPNSPPRFGFEFRGARVEPGPNAALFHWRFHQLAVDKIDRRAGDAGGTVGTTARDAGEAGSVVAIYGASVSVSGGESL